jgi:hypothetical protein
LPGVDPVCRTGVMQRAITPVGTQQSRFGTRDNTE